MVDDCSTDGTFGLLRQIASEDRRIRVFRNKNNEGVAKTRNRAIREAAGKYIAFLDGDDIWLPKKLLVQIDFMEKNPCVFSFTEYELIDANDRPLKMINRVPDRLDYRLLLRGNAIGCSTVLLLRETLKNQSFNPDYSHEDYVLWLDLLKGGGVARGIPQTLTGYRFVEGSRSNDKIQSAINVWKIYRRYIRLPLHNAAWLFGVYAAGKARKYAGR